MRMQRAVRAVVAADVFAPRAAGFTRSRLLCTNAAYKAPSNWGQRGGNALTARRWFSESRTVGGAAQAVYVWEPEMTGYH